jgi:hypothetical protein
MAMWAVLSKAELNRLSHGWLLGAPASRRLLLKGMPARRQMPHFLKMRPKGAMECDSLLPPWTVCRIFRVCSKEKGCLRLWDELVSARFAINWQSKAAASCRTPRRLRRVIKNCAAFGETPVPVHENEIIGFDVSFRNADLTLKKSGDSLVEGI